MHGGIVGISRRFLLVLIYKAIPVFLMFACNASTDQEYVNTSSANVQTTEKNSDVPDTSATRPLFPGGDAIQLNCEFIQDQAEILLEEYYKQSTPEIRLKEIVVELKKLDQEWTKSDCRQVFGFMVPKIPA